MYTCALQLSDVGIGGENKFRANGDDGGGSEEWEGYIYVLLVRKRTREKLYC